jgi:Protein of unknown function (DUF3071)
MRELRFDGLSDDGARLVLAGNDGQRYTVEIDERLEAAVRRDRARMSQVELEQAGVLRPREIQARIRAGATAEDVAAASGLPLEHVRRFEGPVQTERAWVAQQAQATEVRRPGGDIELGRLVTERLGSIGVDAAVITWDAWRRDDGLWVVIATFPVPPNTHVATWTYDSGGRTMTMVDDNARALSAIAPDAPLELAPQRPTLTAVVPVAEFVADTGDVEVATTILIERGSAEPDSGELGDTTPEPAGEPVDESGTTPEPAAEQTEDEVADGSEPGQDAPDDAELEQEAATEGPTADAEDVPLFEAPETPPARPAGKPHIPSFDDILFGPGRSQ